MKKEVDQFIEWNRAIGRRHSRWFKKRTAPQEDANDPDHDILFREAGTEEAEEHWSLSGYLVISREGIRH